MTAQQLVDEVAPILTVRSDTFKIRAYGDAMNPADVGVAGARPEAVAYCEAIVQRTNDDDPLGHGEKFVITYFRWLGPDDIQKKLVALAGKMCLLRHSFSPG